MRERGLVHVYLDASVVLRRLFRSPDAISIWEHWDTACSSELLRVEVLRTIDRLFRQRELGEIEAVELRATFLEWVECVDFVQLDSSLMSRASDSFPVSLATLDALHLATALAWREQYGAPLALWTHDRQLALAARSMGFEVEGISHS